MADLPASLSALFNLRPDRAADYLKAKGLKLTGPYWELDGPAHSRNFTVANLAKLDVLADIKDAVQGAIDSGQTERWFRQQLEGTLRQKGWWGPLVQVDPDTLEDRIIQAGSQRRLQTIYRTNLQSAYMAGRHAQAVEQADRAPFAQYLAVRDSRTRPAHAALHGKVFRLDSPEWSVASPPNGYNCRCRARYLSQRELDRRGLKPETDVRILQRTPQRIPTDPLTGESPARIIERGVSVPSRTRPGERDVLWADRGWDHLPGSDGAERALVDRVLQQAGQAGAPLGAVVAGAVLARAQALDVLTAEFGAWARHWYDIIDTVPKGGKVPLTGELRNVGAMTPMVVAELDKRGIVPESAALSVRDIDIVHAHRFGKTGELDRDWYAALPRHLAAPKAVLLDDSHQTPALFYVYDAPNGQADKLVVQIDYRVKVREATGKRQIVRANIVNTGRVLDRAYLEGLDALEGSL